MANGLQKSLYVLSSASPLLLVFSVVWGLQKGFGYVPLLCVILFVIIVFAFALSFNYGYKHCAQTEIHAIEISSLDSKIIEILVTTLLPAFGLIIDDLNIWTYGIVAICLFFFATRSYSVNLNVLLSIIGYHYYSISAENGIADYVLISKRKLRNKNELRYVRRVFEYLLLDVEG